MSCTSQTIDTFDISIWADESTTEKEFPDGALIDGPCGPRLLRSVASFNDLSPDERNGLERVLEYVDSDNVVGEWQMPVDEVPQGISGEWLIVGRPGDYMAMNLEGELRHIEIPEDVPDPEYEGLCSERVREAFLGESGESAYLRCWTLTDVSTGVSRGVAFQGPCT